MLTILTTFGITEVLNIAAIVAVIFYRKKIKSTAQAVIADVKTGG